MFLDLVDLESYSVFTVKYYTVKIKYVEVVLIL